MSHETAPKPERPPIHKRVGRALGRLAGRGADRPSEAYLAYEKERAAEHEALAKRGREGRAKVGEAVKEVVEAKYGRAFDRLKGAVAARKPGAEKAVTETKEGLELKLKWDLERKVKTESIGSRPKSDIDLDVDLFGGRDSYVSEMVPTTESLTEEVGKVEKAQERKAYEFGKLVEWASTAAGGERAGAMIGQRRSPESERKLEGGEPAIDNERDYSDDSLDMIYNALGAQRPSEEVHESERIRRRKTDGERDEVVTKTPAGITIVETWRIGRRGDEHMPIDSDAHMDTATSRLQIGSGPAKGHAIEGELHYITFYPSAVQQEAGVQSPAA